MLIFVYHHLLLWKCGLYIICTSCHLGAFFCALLVIFPFFEEHRVDQPTRKHTITKTFSSVLHYWSFSRTASSSGNCSYFFIILYYLQSTILKTQYGVCSPQRSILCSHPRFVPSWSVCWRRWSNELFRYRMSNNWTRLVMRRNGTRLLCWKVWVIMLNFMLSIMFLPM